MTRARLVLEVTVWEFRRWFKLRDQFITLSLSIVFGLAVWGGLALLLREREKPVDLAVLGQDLLPFTLPEDGRIELSPLGGRTKEELRAAVARQELDGLLVIESSGHGTLLVRQEPRWLPALQAALTQARRAQQLTTLNVSEQELATVLTPYELGIEYDEGSAGPTSRAARVTAITIILLMMMGVAIGLGLQFVAITGEKQLRVTEQVVSAISPQTWIDGKILGVSLVALTTLLTYLLGIVFFLGMSWVVGRNIPIPVGVVGAEVWFVLVPVALGGFLFWNTFYAAVAATIDDPNTSARSSLMIVPILPSALALLRLGNPDTPLTQFFAVFPPTAPAFLTLRLMLTRVPPWEIITALVLLVAGVALLRRLAGKIFGLGILMYGKEPSWSEMLRWLRSA